MRLLVATAAVLLVAMVMTASAVVVPPEPGGAGRNCKSHYVAKAVVDTPGKAALVVRWPQRPTRIHYGGRDAFRMQVTKHSAAVFSETTHRLEFHVLCRKG